jgi:hypothetical protein
MLAGIGQLYQSHAPLTVYPFFENSLKGNTLQGFDQLSMMNSLTVFMVRQNNLEALEKSVPVYSYLSENGGTYTKMFLPQNIKYLQGFITQKTDELNQEAEAHDKNNNAAYANQTRQQIKKYKDISSQLSSLEAPTTEMKH